jgi:hypothetical protein
MSAGANRPEGIQGLGTGAHHAARRRVRDSLIGLATVIYGRAGADGGRHRLDSGRDHLIVLLGLLALHVRRA